MRIKYKNILAEKILLCLSVITSIVVVATFVLLYGFDEYLLPVRALHIIQIIAFMMLLAEKTLRFTNAFSKVQYFEAYWFEIPLLVALTVVVLGAGRWFAIGDAGHATMLGLGVYLIVQVVAKACAGCVNIASTGKNPTQALLILFLVLIIAGAGLLMLPKSYNTTEMSFVDALFTATSATCVTGLIVKDTGTEFSFMGQIVILTLIQLGGLGIVVFGAVLALLLGQALSVRESVAMQDLLSAQTLGRIGNIIGFIFITTIVIEAAGAVSLLNTWEPAADVAANIHKQWFFSVFHSISAFCNAGFSLNSDSLISYSSNPAIYLVIAPLIVLGGLGFGVMYNISSVTFDKMKRLWRKKINPNYTETMLPRKISLQTKIVVSTSLILIIVGTIGILILENNAPQLNTTSSAHTEHLSVTSKLAAAFFQSVTARTAGFNTIDIASMAPASRFVMIILMLIGGSPGSTAGGIKTVTLAVIVMVGFATFRKREEVEIFKKSIHSTIVSKAITVMLLFAIVLTLATLALNITERETGIASGDLLFETSSALGTVGLSTGITASLTTAGKFIIIITMLIGRLGPLTLLATMAFNLKPARYNYPNEPIVVG